MSRKKRKNEKIHTESLHNLPKKPQISETKISFLQKLIPPSILALLTTIFYYPSLTYEFQFDDLANITKNFGIRFTNYLSRWMSSRWMGYWLNRINYQMGEFDPFYYRLTNLIIHLLAGILLFFLILDLCRFLKQKPFFYNNALIIAFTSSALFLLHPVQTQTVSYVIQGRLDGLAGFFIIAALFCYTRIFKSKTIFSKVLFAILTCIISFFSWGSKEVVIIIPFVALLVDWFFISQEKWKSFKTRLLIYSAFCAVFCIGFLFYWNIGILKKILSLSMTVGNNRGNILTQTPFDQITAFSFLTSQFKVILHYLFMFIWPYNISVEYDWKLPHSFFSLDSFFPFLALVALIALSIYAIVKKKHTFFSFGFLWFIIGIFPRSSIMPSPELICDYKTYAASAGWIFVIAVALVYLFKTIIKHIKHIPTVFLHTPSYQLVALTILMIPVGLGMMNRNTVWKSSVNFWGDIVKKAPLKARGHNNYGVALSEAGRVDESIKHYKKAIALDRYYADPLSNIAVAYSMKNEIDKAINALKGAINIFPNYAEAYNNLGTLLLKKENYAEAEKCLKHAVLLRKYYGKAHYNLGRLYLAQNQEEKAWKYFKQATEGDLDNPQGFFTLGQMSLKLKKYNEAIKAFENIRKKGVSNAQIEFNLANAYFMEQDIDKAQTIYLKLTQEFPLDSRYLYNLGETMVSKNELTHAIEIFKKVTTLPQPVANAHFRIATCLEKLHKLDEAKKYLNSLLSLNATEEFKQMARNEISRIDLTEKVNKGNGSIRLSELKKSLSKAVPEQVKNKKEKEKKQA